MQINYQLHSLKNFKLYERLIFLFREIVIHWHTLLISRIKRNQREKELENIETTRKRLEESYQSRVKVLDEGEHELQEEIKALAPAIKRKKSHCLALTVSG